MSFLLFGGEFPGDSIIPRLYIIHVLLIPGLLLALIAAHMLLLVYHKHTQWPGPGRTEQNVVGFPMLPGLRRQGRWLLLHRLRRHRAHGRPAVDQPGVEVRPLRPVQGDRGLPARLVHGLARRRAADHARHWRRTSSGHTISWNVMLPIIVLPMLLFTLLMMLPFIEAWITGDKRDHHLLQRPRNAPTRTAIMVALMTFYGLLWAAGGNDIIAIKLHLTINQITYFMRVAVFIGPVIAFSSPAAGASRCSARTTRRCCTATRPASSCAPPRAATPSGTCRSTRTPPTRSPRATATRSTRARERHRRQRRRPRQGSRSAEAAGQRCRR